jgi:hypothetical protein
VTLQDLHAEMINDCFAKYGKPESAPAQTQPPNKPAHRRRGGQGGAAGAFREGQARAASMAGKMPLWEEISKPQIFTQSLTQYHISRL